MDFLGVLFREAGRIGEVVTRVDSSPLPACVTCAASEPSIFGNIDFFGLFAAAGDFPFVGVLAEPGALVDAVELPRVVMWDDGGVAMLLGVVGLLRDWESDPLAGTTRLGMSPDGSFPSSLVFLFSVPRAFRVVSTLALVLFSLTLQKVLGRVGDKGQTLKYLRSSSGSYQSLVHIPWIHPPLLIER